MFAWKTNRHNGLSVKEGKDFKNIEPQGNYNTTCDT